MSYFSGFLLLYLHLFCSTCIYLRNHFALYTLPPLPFSYIYLCVVTLPVHPQSNTIILRGLGSPLRHQALCLLPSLCKIKLLSNIGPYGERVFQFPSSLSLNPLAPLRTQYSVLSTQTYSSLTLSMSSHLESQPKSGPNSEISTLPSKGESSSKPGTWHDRICWRSVSANILQVWSQCLWWRHSKSQPDIPQQFQVELVGLGIWEVWGPDLRGQAWIRSHRLQCP